MALIAAGTNNYEVSLVNLQTSDVEVLLTVDDSKNKDNFAATIPVVPSYIPENVFEIGTSITRKYETNQSLFRRYLNSTRSSQHFAC